MKVENGTWGEAAEFPWALLPLGSRCLPACPPARAALCSQRLAYPLVNVLPGCEQPVSHPPGKHLCEKAVPGQSQCWKGRSSSTCPVLHRENKALQKAKTC